jgi:hypothetical protein
VRHELMRLDDQRTYLWIACRKIDGAFEGRVHQQGLAFRHKRAETRGAQTRGRQLGLAFFPVASQFIGFVTARIGIVTGGTFPCNAEVAAVEIEAMALIGS